ncbi:hypothetical protein ACSQ67_011431 [Phaseolus vulgaris]
MHFLTKQVFNSMLHWPKCEPNKLKTNHPLQDLSYLNVTEISEDAEQNIMTDQGNQVKKKCDAPYQTFKGGAWLTEVALEKGVYSRDYHASGHLSGAFGCCACLRLLLHASSPVVSSSPPVNIAPLVIVAVVCLYSNGGVSKRSRGDASDRQRRERRRRERLVAA